MNYFVLLYLVSTQQVKILDSSNYCFEFNDQRMVWLLSPMSTNDCICDVVRNISGCECVNNTIYNISLNNGNICFNNLTKKMNKTKVFFFLESLHRRTGQNILEPVVTRTYLQSYEIFIIGKYSIVFFP